MNKSACLMFNRCRIDYKCLQERERERALFFLCVRVRVFNEWMNAIIV